MSSTEQPQRLTLSTFPTVAVVGPLGSSLAVPCEPVTDGLVITPYLDLGENVPQLGGGFNITHVPTGRLIVSGQACLECAREVGRRLAATGVRWPEIDANDPRGFDALGDQRKAVVDALRLFEKCQQRMCFIDGDDEPCGACGMVRQHASYCMHVVVPMVAGLSAEAVTAR